MPKAWPLFLVFTLAGCTQSFSQSNLLNLFAAPQTPKSWDYRIGQVVSGSASQVVSQDLWGSTPETTTSLKKAGKVVLCYFSAGTWEYQDFSRLNVNKVLTNGSGDVAEAQAVSAALQAGKTSYVYAGKTLPLKGQQPIFQKLAGQQLPGWEEYIYKIAGFTPTSNTPEHQLLRQLMIEHLKEAKNLGCDGVEPDNIDAHLTGSGITATDQYRYNVWLADTAHSMGLKILLKNDLGQIADGAEQVPKGEVGLARIYDGIINEECFKFQECQLLKPFADLGKPIFVREYLVKDCTAFKAGPYSPTDKRTREQVARSLKLNVSGSKHDNGGSPDANANPTTCAFGVW